MEVAAVFFSNSWESNQMHKEFTLDIIHDMKRRIVKVDQTNILPFLLSTQPTIESLTDTFLTRYRQVCHSWYHRQNTAQLFPSTMCKIQHRLKLDFEKVYQKQVRQVVFIHWLSIQSSSRSKVLEAVQDCAYDKCKAI